MSPPEFLTRNALVGFGPRLLPPGLGWRGKAGLVLAEWIGSGKVDCGKWIGSGRMDWLGAR